MAKAAAIAVDIFGFAGLISAFKDTIELFSIIANTRHISKEYEILDMKLDIEKTLLLQWADRVELFGSDCDRRLHDVNLQTLVFQVLSAIRSTLTDANKLQQRYGLCSEQDLSLQGSRLDPNLLNPQPEFDLPSELLKAELPSVRTKPSKSFDSLRSRRGISQKRTERFIQQLKKFQLSTTDDLNHASMPQKARWVIGDKKKFEHLIIDLAQLISKLHDLVPPLRDHPPSHQSKMILEDLTFIRKDLGNLKVVLEAATGHHDVVAQTAQKALNEIREQHILDTLWFRKINDRSESISANHEKTLRWALKTPQDSTSWDDLPAWLRTGSGIFWVSGKAGSGKSTLMKYLLNNERTRAFLSEWAQGGEFLPCHFFFSNLGSDEQKTQQGLLRTLLYQILIKNRSLIPHALPKMWRDMVKSEANLRRGDLWAKPEIDPPSPTETRAAFESISRNTSITGKLCFFIDGLDEIEGGYAGAIDIVQQLASNEGVKVIVSSRPIPACVAAFHNAPRLQLQDLTYHDIEAYVQHTVGSHPSLKKHIRRFPEESNSLLRGLVEKSSGVWLWIILACRSILSGFDDHDRLSEIQRRVDELPPELENMFTHMLGKVEKRHQRQGAQLLKICYKYQQTKPPFVQKGLFALGLALVDDYHMNPIEIYGLGAEDQKDICEELEGRLRSRCWGLIELRKGPDGKLTNSKVVFMHRTVFEFLNRDDVWTLDCFQTPDALFDAAVALSLHGIHMAMQKLSSNDEIAAMDLFEEGIWWGSMADKDRPQDPRNCLLHLESFLNTLPKRNFITATMRRLSEAVAQETTHCCLTVAFLLAVEANAVNLVKSHPNFPRILNDQKCTDRCQPVLYHALRKQFLSSGFSYNARQGMLSSTQMVHMLLSAGCDATQRVDTHMGNVTLASIWLSDSEDLNISELDRDETSMLRSTKQHMQWSIEKHMHQPIEQLKGRNTLNQTTVKSDKTLWHHYMALAVILFLLSILYTNLAS